MGYSVLSLNSFGSRALSFSDPYIHFACLSVLSFCWLARCKLQATLIIAQRVCVCVCVCVFVCVWHFLVNINAKYLGNEAI